MSTKGLKWMLGAWVSVRGSCHQVFYLREAGICSLIATHSHGTFPGTGSSTLRASIQRVRKTTISFLPFYRKYAKLGKPSFVLSISCFNDQHCLAFAKLQPPISASVRLRLSGAGFRGNSPYPALFFKCKCCVSATI